MYICQKCGKSSQPSEPMTRVVVETRWKQYDNGGVGQEIATEEIRCPRCILEVKDETK